MSIKSALNSLKQWQKTAIVAVGVVLVGGSFLAPVVKIANAEQDRPTASIAERFKAKVVRNLEKQEDKLFLIDNGDAELLLDNGKKLCSAKDNGIAFAMVGGIDGLSEIISAKSKEVAGKHSDAIARSLVVTSIASDCDSLESGEVQP